MENIYENIECHRLRYSQSYIRPYFNYGRTSVETFIDVAPLEVMQLDGESYVSLYSAKAYDGANQMIRCVVRQAFDPVTTIMQDYALDMLTLIWVNNEILYRLILRAKTIEGIVKARCADQSSNFPLLGSEDAPLISPQRNYDNNMVQIIQFNVNFEELHEPYIDTLINAEEIYINRVSHINIYKKRNDLVSMICEHPELFSLDRYERLTNFTLQVRGEIDPNVWDEWDDLLAATSEAEFDREYCYLLDFFNSLKVY